MENDDWDPPQPSSDEKIWRYRSLGQYVTLLDQEQLWFNRADNFGDPFEGSLPTQNIENRAEAGSDRVEAEEATYKSLRALTYLNCWHTNDHESDAMWKIYTGNMGISIISTPHNLQEAIDPSDQMEFGKVKYIDYQEEEIPKNSTVAQFFHKRNGFEHESEYRALYRDWDGIPDEGIPQVKLGEFQNSGNPIAVDVDELIEKVLVAPGAPDWLDSTVESVTEQYGYDFTIEPSPMNENPRF